MNIKNSIKKETIHVNGKDFNVHSQLFDEQYLLYRNFIISKDAGIVGMYKLGITKAALKICNYKQEFDPSTWIFDQGLAMLSDMIATSDFSRDSGLITSLEMSNNQFEWQKLEPFSLTEVYYR